MKPTPLSSTISLSGIWRLRAADETEAVPCPIPGDNYSALQDAGRIPDPYWRDNERRVQWVSEKDWVFSRAFDVPAELLRHRAVYLSFDSIDTVAEVFVNGRRAGRADNQFRRWRFEAKRLLRPGENELEVRIASPRRAAVEAHRALAPELDPDRTNGGSVLALFALRKCQCSGGWDWGVSLPASGIYGNVELIPADAALLDAAWTTQAHRAGACRVDVTVRLLPVPGAPAGAPVEAEVVFDGEARTVRGRVPAAPGPFELAASFRVAKPRLWWPNGYGAQPLYPLSVAVGAQRIERRIGLRRLEVDRTPDKAGARFAIRVNGVPVFAKGADWIPCDARPRHEDDSRVGDLLRSAAAANMTMLRVWGGGHFGSDFLYDECDRLGLLLWHDMMFACMRYPTHPDFVASVRAETEHQVRRLRDHACIALWCGDNECLSSVDWGHKPREQREAETAQWAILNRAIGEAVRAADPTRLFWPSSPCAAPGDFRHNNGNLGSGDTHYWAVWHGGQGFEAYYEHRPRFCSEFGFQSLPSPETVRTFASEKDGDLNLYSPVLDWHQKCWRGNAAIFGMFGRYFRMPRGFDEALYLSQVQQAEAIRTGVDFWRSLRPHCMGTIFWQLNDDWPVASWASLEYGGRWKALHHAARRFYAPLAASAFRPGLRAPLEAHLAWDLPVAVEAKVAVTLRRFSDGAPVRSWTLRESLPRAGARRLALPDELAAPLPDLSVEAERARWKAAPLPTGREAPDAPRGAVDPTAHFLVLETEGRTADGRVFRHEATVALDVWKRCALPVSGLAIRRVAPAKDEKGAFDVELAAKAPAFFAWVADPADARGRFSDNLVTVLPGAPRVLRYRPSARTTAADLRRRLAVMDLRASY